MKKEDVESKEHLRSHSSYIIGIIAIVLSLFNPLSGIVLGVVGLVQSVKQKNSVSKRAKRFNIIAIILGVIVLVASILLAGLFSNIASAGY